MKIERGPVWALEPVDESARTEAELGSIEEAQTCAPARICDCLWGDRRIEPIDATIWRIRR